MIGFLTVEFAYWLGTCLMYLVCIWLVGVFTANLSWMLDWLLAQIRRLGGV